MSEKCPDPPPTTPDVQSLKCPECEARGFVVTHDPRGELMSQSCGVCFGTRFISRRAYDEWKLRRGAEPGENT